MGEGRDRVVFQHGNFVVKIPKGDTGYCANETEASRFKNRENWAPVILARCRLLKNGWLVMEYAEPMRWQDAPEWADWVDCRQVGRTRDGRVVAYDYGS